MALNIKEEQDLPYNQVLEWLFLKVHLCIEGNHGADPHWVEKES
jgi:hypothetical protein